MEIPDLNEHVVMSALKMWLKSSKLTFSIDKISLKDYAALLEKVHKYALAKEQVANHHKVERNLTKKDNKATEA